MAKAQENVVKESVVEDSKNESSNALTAKEIAKKKLARIIEEEGKKLVKGRFKNYETPGAAADIIVRKFPEKDVPLFKKKMTDGEVYEIPLYVARHLNGTDVCAEAVGGKINTCAYLVHGFAANPDGSVVKSEDSGIPVPILTNKYKRRYGFESLEFSA